MPAPHYTTQFSTQTTHLSTTYPPRKWVIVVGTGGLAGLRNVSNLLLKQNQKRRPGKMKSKGNESPRKNGKSGESEKRRGKTDRGQCAVSNKLSPLSMVWAKTFFMSTLAVKGV